MLRLALQHAVAELDGLGGTVHLRGPMSALRLVSVAGLPPALVRPWEIIDQEDTAAAGAGRAPGHRGLGSPRPLRHRPAHVGHRPARHGPGSRTGVRRGAPGRRPHCRGGPLGRAHQEALGFPHSCGRLGEGADDPGSTTRPPRPGRAGRQLPAAGAQGRPGRDLGLEHPHRRTVLGRRGHGHLRHRARRLHAAGRELDEGGPPRRRAVGARRPREGHSQPRCIPSRIPSTTSRRQLRLDPGARKGGARRRGRALPDDRDGVGQQRVPVRP